jgi:membrane-bound lytic murein transglycosylase D
LKTQTLLKSAPDRYFGACFRRSIGTSLLAAVCSLTWLAGCASTGSKPASGSATATIGPNGEVIPAGGVTPLREVESYRVTDPEPPRVADEELDRIPVEINEKVEQWLRYFQGRGRPHMERYLSRSSRYSKLMKRILRENGLPEDLIYIALIESGFNQKATSHASAVGYWQFIRGTGKRYGMEINALVDERRDPVLSTQAAAEYYKALYSIFGSWYLAMASYNVGENRVQREITNHKTRDFWELVRKRRLPKETMNYVPKYIAAKLIGNDPVKYGFTDIEWEDPVEFELVRIDNPVNLRIMADKMKIDYEVFKQINPKFRGEIAPTKTSGILELRVPLGQSAVAMVAARESLVDKVEFIADAGETKTHRIRRGESLATVARKYKTTVAWIREVNDLGGRRKLRIGQRIQVPDRSRRPTPDVRTVVAKREQTPTAPTVAVPAPASQPAAVVTPAPTSVAGAPMATDATKAAPAAVVAAEVSSDRQAQEPASQKTEIVTERGVYYVVQPGDSLYSIAQEYDSSVKELKKMNKIKRGRLLKVGAKILVPKDDRLPEEPTGSTTPDANAQQVQPSNVEETETDQSPDSSVKTEAQNSNVATEQSRPTSQPIVGRQLGAPRIATPPRSSSTTLRDPSAAGSRVHVVKRGDNLFRIAKKYGTSMKAIQSQNSLRSAAELAVGRRLVIPE